MVKHFKEFMNLDVRQGKVLICGEEGAGKTLLSTYIGVQKMLRGLEDCWKSYARVDEYNRLGYNFSKDYEHLLFSNYNINCLGTYIPTFRTHMIDPFQIGLKCEDYETKLLPPLSFIIITEAQTVFNAYMWQYIRPEIRRYWETSRQAEIELVMDTNQPELVYKGMRNLCNRIIYLHEKTQEILDRHGFVVGHKLFVKEFKKYSFFERYLQTNNADLVKEEYTLILDRCVYENYDSKQCRYLHLKGRENEDYYVEYFPDIKTIDDVETFADNFGLYAREGYYVKPGQIKDIKANAGTEVSDNFEFDVF